jgi:hypothetical protein
MFSDRAPVVDFDAFKDKWANVCYLGLTPRA